MTNCYVVRKLIKLIANLTKIEEVVFIRRGNFGVAVVE